MDGGNKITNADEVSIRWQYAGIAPYTPFDEEQSAEINSGVFDQSQINGQRYIPIIGLEYEF